MNVKVLFPILAALAPLGATAGEHVITNESIGLGRFQVIEVHNPDTGQQRAVAVEESPAAEPQGRATTVKGYTREEVQRFIAVFGHPPPAK